LWSLDRFGASHEAFALPQGFPGAVFFLGSSVAVFSVISYQQIDESAWCVEMKGGETRCRIRSDSELPVEMPTMLHERAMELAASALILVGSSGND
jgi:hypothetical protein